MDNKKKKDTDYIIGAVELKNTEKGLEMVNEAAVNTRDARPIDKDVERD